MTPWWYCPWKKSLYQSETISGLAKNVEILPNKRLQLLMKVKQSDTVSGNAQMTIHFAIVLQKNIADNEKGEFYRK